MIFDDNFFERPDIKQYIEEYSANYDSEIEAREILKKSFYFDPGDDYKSFYDIESFVEFFEVLNKISAPQLLIEIKTFSNEISKIELTFNNIPFDYEKDATRYSDDYIYDKINIFLQKHNICKERYIEFLTKHFSCVGFMSTETYEKMKDKNFILIMDGIDDQERFW